MAWKLKTISIFRSYKLSWAPKGCAATTACVSENRSQKSKEIPFISSEKGVPALSNKIQIGCPSILTDDKPICAL